jgi:hypothetical protein
MPTPDFVAMAADHEALGLYLSRLELRVQELERRTIGSGQRITLGGFTLSAAGNTLIATRLSDGATRVVADFS